MSEILKGFLLGKDYYQLVEIYCNSEFSAYQMNELLLCIKEGLTKDQIKSIAHPHSLWEEMRQKRLEFVRINQGNRLSDVLDKLT